MTAAHLPDCGLTGYCARGCPVAASRWEADKAALLVIGEEVRAGRLVVDEEAVERIMEPPPRR